LSTNQDDREGRKVKKVFISYSHRDQEWLDRLLIHIAPLGAKDGIDFWSDTRISAGKKWKDEITNAIDSASAAVLMISADFLASDFVTKVELPRILQANEKKGMLLLPLIVKPSVFSAVESLSEIEALNDPNRSLVEMAEPERERLLAKVAIEIWNLLPKSLVADPHQSTEVESSEAEAPNVDVFHPAGTELARGPLEPCRFFIHPLYQSTSLWNTYADLLVEIVNAPVSGKAYLIPSGYANPRLRHTRHLERSKEDLKRKRMVTIEFAKQFDKQELVGQRFAMRTAAGDERIKVYSQAYDRFLNSSLSGQAS
jgi:hypothetical protein